MNDAEQILKYFIQKKKKMGWSAPKYYWQVEYKVPEDLMSAWYLEARDTWNLSAHYKVFKDCVENEVFYDREAYWKERRSKWKMKEQKNGSFKKQNHHKKKNLSIEEQNKRAWRKKVKDPRDQGSAHWANKSNDFTVVANRAERRYTKAKLASSYFGKHFDGWKICGTDGCYKEYEETDWDNYTDKKKREWCNPWDWD